MNNKKLLFLSTLLISFFILKINAQNFNTDQLDMKVEDEISTILNNMTIEEKV